MKKTTNQEETAQIEQFIPFLIFSIFSLNISKPFSLFSDPLLLPVPTTGSYCPPNAEQNMPASSSQIQTINCNVPTTTVSANSCEIPEN